MIRHIASVTTAFVLAAAAPVSDPLQARLIADARALGPPSAVDVAATIAAEGTKSVRVERLDGSRWSLVSLDGKPPAEKDAAEVAKRGAAPRVPGYYRLGQFLNAPAARGSDAQGNPVLKFASLPPGSVDIGGDRSDRFAAEATVDTSRPQPFVRRMHLYATAPFRIMIVAKIDRFDVVNDYAIGPSGRPQLVHQVQDYAGSRPGQSGAIRTETVFTYRD